ncbi:MAG TPA: hypothetical protein EYP59_05275 [Thiotrichaceae bacterium]|nr:hypothetical protein [Thiotrichaceae bacterium]
MLTIKQYHVLWFFSVLLMFLIVHATNYRIDYLLEWSIEQITQSEFLERSLFNNFFNVLEPNQYKSTLIFQVINPFKSLFTLSLLTICFPIFKEIKSHLKANQYIEQPILKKLTISSLLALFILSIFIMPLNGITLTGYLQMSIDPYAETAWSSVELKRFLLPFLGHIFLLKGEILYFLLHIVCIFSLIFLIQIWFLRNDVNLKFYQLISLLTSSFIMHQFQVVGNPEVLVFIIWLLCISFPFSDISKLSLLVMALLAHEASLFISPILSLFIFDKKRSVISFYIVCIVYLVFWIVAHGLNIGNALNSHNVGGLNALQWLVRYPERELLGLFFSYKALWILIITALIILFRTNQFRVAIQIILLLSGSLIMTLAGVDTARLMGWSFIAILLSIKTIYAANSYIPRKFIHTVCIVNILIPSLYVGLNTGGMYYFPGLYNLLTNSILTVLSL